MTKKTSQIIAKTFCVLLTLGMMSGCTHDQTTPLDTMQGMKSQTEARLATAASEAIQAGQTKEALHLYEARYGETPKNKEIALNYAQLLRKSDRAEDAVKVLTPLIGNPSKPDQLTFDTGLLSNELAAAYIQLGYFKPAEEKLSLVIDNPELKNLHADSSNLLGIAKDAQSDHRTAEKLFRAALENWHGDATSVMNNLALSLASQAKFDESLNILRRALVIAPEKTELARNIELVEDLRNAVIPKAPIGLTPKKMNLKN